ncbi:uncharacterized protein UTRI_04701 [Ustilago trichophora]|uniref:CCHC-type domain-containing protein n=1 Tax=Ustilago trichophora TaxID=86804 RepID=A0A5C3ECA9_9BASI|nr:uncharacterized protein UTRI_04701 [Ustilago trichophora]
MVNSNRNRRRAVLLYRIPTTTPLQALAMFPPCDMPDCDIDCSIDHRGGREFYSLFVPLNGKDLLRKAHDCSQQWGCGVQIGTYGRFREQKTGRAVTLPRPNVGVPLFPGAPKEVPSHSAAHAARPHQSEPPLAAVSASRSLPALFSAARQEGREHENQAARRATQSSSIASARQTTPYLRQRHPPGASASGSDASRTNRGVPEGHSTAHLRERPQLPPVVTEVGEAEPVHSSARSRPPVLPQVATGAATAPSLLRGNTPDVSAGESVPGFSSQSDGSGTTASPILMQWTGAGGPSQDSAPSVGVVEARARWQLISARTPILGNLSRPIEDESKELLQRMLSLADQLPRGQYMWYPPLSANATFSSLQLEWILKRKRNLCARVASTAEVQKFSDAFCRHFVIARMHGSYFVARLLGTPAVPTEVLDAFESIRVHWSIERIFTPVIRRIVTLLTQRPPHYVHCDSIYTVQLLTADVWFLLLAQAVWDLYHLTLPVQRLRQILSARSELYTVGEDRQELWDAFMALPMEPNNATLIAAAGARPRGIILDEDKVYFNCEPIVKVERSPEWAKSRSKWSKVAIPASAMQDVYGIGVDAQLGYVVRFRGMRDGGTQPMATLHEHFVNLQKAMSPAVASSGLKHRLFQLVQPVLVQHRFGATPNGIGPMEIEFHFASQSHATMALLTVHRWAHWLELSDAKLVVLEGEEGHRGWLCALFCVIVVPVPEDLPEYLGAFGKNTLSSTPESICVVAKDGDQYHVVLRYRTPMLARQMMGVRVQITSRGEKVVYSSPLVPHIPMDVPSVCTRCGRLGHPSESCPSDGRPVHPGSSCQLCKRVRTLDERMALCTQKGKVKTCVLVSGFMDNAKAMRDVLLENWDRDSLFAEEHSTLLSQLFDEM